MLGRILIGVGLFILLVAAWVGWRTYQTYRHLEEARSTAAELQAVVAADGISQADSLVSLAERFRQQVGDARAAMSDPLCRMVTPLPWVGENLGALRGITETVDAIGQALPDAVRLAVSLDAGNLMVAGAVDLDLVRGVSTQMITLDEAVQQATATAESIDRRHLIGPIDTVVGEALSDLQRVGRFSTTAGALGRVLPGMLGESEPRQYAVVFQNLAEPRATGGIFGSFVLLGVDSGRISILDQGSASRDIGSFDPPITTLPAELEALYTDLPARYPTDVNLTPDFPTAAQLFAQMYAARRGVTVDGVVAVDPGLVRVLLTDRPPIVLPDGDELTPENAVSFLLSSIYQKFPTADDARDRDAYVAAATSQVFELILGDGIAEADLSSQLVGLRNLAAQRRLLVWSARDGEQGELLGTPFGGRMVPDALGKPSLGVFLNDGTGSKLGYYLDTAVTLTASECGAGGARSLNLAATLHYRNPPADLPPYVLITLGVPYRLRENLLLFAPTGGSIGEVLVGGAAVPVAYGTDSGRSVAMVTVELEPGATVTVTAVATVADPPDGRTVQPTVFVTPQARPPATSATPYDPCSP